MLSVFIHLVAVALMLIGIEVPVFQIELDSLNDPTPRPIPRGTLINGIGRIVVQVSARDLFLGIE